MTQRVKLNFDQIVQGRRSKAKLHIVPFVENGENTKKTALLKAFTALYPFLVALIGGIYLGVGARSAYESYIYAGVLLLESFICVISGCVCRNSAIRAKLKSFMSYFALAGVMCPITCQLWLYFLSKM